MMMRPNKAETAICGCHCRVIWLCVSFKVLARMWVGVLASVSQAQKKTNDPPLSLLRPTPSQYFLTSPLRVQLLNCESKCFFFLDFVTNTYIINVPPFESIQIASDYKGFSLMTFSIDLTSNCNCC